ncbi:unnamed protein product, partial [Symbiodinium microadriaticum]
MTDERFPHIEHEMFLEWVVPKGDHDETYWRAMLQAMVDAQRATGKGRIFIDRSSGPAGKPVEPMVVYRMALLMAESFGAAVRVAVQSPAAGTDNFFEDVATNRGLATITESCLRIHPTSFIRVMEKLHVELIEHPHYLEYVCSGEHVFDDWVELLQQIRADATRKEETRILINVLGLLQPIDNMMRYRLGLLVGEKIGASLKVAALNPADEVNHFWET